MHTFKITVEHIADQKGNPVTEPPLVFKVENHDDMVAMAARFGYREDKQLAFLVGLKLFGETLLQDRDNPLYAEIGPQFGAFMKKLKGARGAVTQTGVQAPIRRSP